MAKKIIKKKPTKNVTTPTKPTEKVEAIVATDRVPTGIPGFDQLVSGGLPKNSSTLMCGGPGTGKTIFCLQYLLNGALEHGEKGLYVSFEQRVEDITGQAKQFGWDLESLDKKGLLKVIAIPIQKITKKTIKDIREYVKKEKIKRLVVDSLSTLVINAPIYTTPSELAIEDVVGENVVFSPPIIGDYVVKRFVYDFIEQLRDLDTTNILISEASQSGEFISRDTLSEFVCDGVILINFESLGGDYSRSLIVRKMRKTKNNEDVHPMEISKEGIKIHSIE